MNKEKSTVGRNALWNMKYNNKLLKLNFTYKSIVQCLKRVYP